MSEHDAYEKKMDAQLAQWQADIDKLKARSKEMEAEAELETSKKIEALEAQKEALKQKLERAKESSEASWQGFKTDMEKAAQDISAGLKAAKSRFSDN